MKNDLLDDELIDLKKEKRVKLLWLHALIGVLSSAVLYFILLMIVYPNFGEKASPQNEFLSGLLSIIHLVMSMMYINGMYSDHENKYDLLVKGGLYILLFGSGVFFVGSVIDIITNAGKAGSLWENHYEAIIIFFIILLKFFLIKPLAKFFSSQ